MSTTSTLISVARKSQNLLQKLHMHPEIYTFVKSLNLAQELCLHCHQFRRAIATASSSKLTSNADRVAVAASTTVSNLNKTLVLLLAFLPHVYFSILILKIDRKKFIY